MRIFLIIFLYLNADFLFGQSASMLMEEGLRFEKEFKLEEALKKYESVLKAEPNHLEALIHASRMTSNIAGHIEDKDARRKKLVVSENYSRRAIKINPGSADAHFSLVLTLALQSEVAVSPREKVKDAKLIREESEKIIELDPNYALGYFVLGKWHFEVSKFNWLERTACDLFFGGFPENVSMEEAKKNFDKAIALDPNQIIILYGQASILHYEGEGEKAIQILHRAISLPVREADDAFRKEKCEKLLKEIKK
jgi:tetratricopeptide (TPR) repeat protein